MDSVLYNIEIFFAVYLPAMIANGSPVFVLRGRKGHPVDFGKNFVDGKRLLGDGKTFEGIIIGVSFGIITAFFLCVFLYNTFGFAMIIYTGLLSSIGAMLGDLVKSFFKRRLGIERGKSLPVADQLDFFLGATILVLLFDNTIKPSFWAFLIGLAVIPLLHRTTNWLAFKFGLKKVPW